MRNFKYLLLLILLCIPSAVYGQELAPAIFLNKSIIETDVPPQIVENRTMVPIRLIAESLNYEVEWKAQDELSPKVLIKNKDASIELIGIMMPSSL